jgi:hypothetical protein
MQCRVALGFVFLGVSASVAGCASGGSFRGTGALSVSGSANQPLLASHAIRFTPCIVYDGTSERPVEDYSIVTIGDACVMRGTGPIGGFRQDPGTVCTLSFPDGPHAIRVTDFSARFGTTSYVTGRAYIDESFIQIELGGDDASTRTHVLYRFSGNASDESSSKALCPASPAERASYVDMRSGW